MEINQKFIISKWKESLSLNTIQKLIYSKRSNLCKKGQSWDFSFVLKSVLYVNTSDYTMHFSIK